MPLLTITTTVPVRSDRKEGAVEEIAETYADVMDSETSYLAVRFREVSRDDLWLGRAGGSNSDIVVLEADIREGRPSDRRRAFVLRFIDYVSDEWDVPRSNVKVVFTEHEGSHMMGDDRVGSDWDAGDET
jgi:phenylpyruvate tautomerase PptA (4-oxalocrotonate tautomerase family)